VGLVSKNVVRAVHWRLIIKFAVVGLVFALYYSLGNLDYNLKLAPHEGYHPEAADNILFVPAFPVFWNALEHSHAGALFVNEFSNFKYDLELGVRKVSGIRPTPTRWQLWLGPQMLAANHGGDWGACFHPGILLRSAGALHALMTSEVDDLGTRQFGDLFYVWHDGFIIVSPHHSYIRAVLESPAISDTSIVASDSLAFQRNGEDTDLMVEIQASREIFLRGYMSDSRFAGGGKPFETIDLPEDMLQPLFVLGATNWADSHIVLDYLLTVLEDGLPEGYSFLKHLTRYLVPDFDVVFQETLDTINNLNDPAAYLILMDIDTSESLPIPEFALISRTSGGAAMRHPFYWLNERAESIPFYWNDRDGLLVPFSGEKMTFCLAQDLRYYYLTSQEPLMAGLLGQCSSGRRLNGDLLLQIYWPAYADMFRDLTMHNARLGLVGTKDDIVMGKNITPISGLLKSLGNLELVGYSREGLFEFRGYLARAELT